MQEALESIFAQTYQYWELILVDDGSTDRSTEIALECSRQHPGRIRYLEHPNHKNRGTSASRNLGLEQAKGEFIAFLDVDDVWTSRKLEQQVSILSAHPEVAMTYGQICFWYSWTGKPEDQQRDSFQDLGVAPDTIIEPPGLLVNLIKQQYQQFGTSNVMIRRSAFEQVGRFEEQIPVMGEDYALFVKLAVSTPIYVSGECWEKYRQHENSLCYIERVQRKHFANRSQLIQWTAQYCTEQKITNKQVWQALKQAAFFYSHPGLYFLLRGYLDAMVLLGQQVLPVSLRHWLWINIGSRLYGVKVEV